MKKMKKVLAVLLTLAMVMAMAVTAFAATKDTATIAVSNADSATLYYLQVIAPDQKSKTGWKFTSGAIGLSYAKAFGVVATEATTMTSDEAQKAIAMLCKAALNGSSAPEGTPSIITAATAASAAQINQALNNVLNSETFINMTTNPQTVNSAGVYVIKATETGFIYKPMAAYVGFGIVTVGEGEQQITYDYPSLQDATLEAKKIPTNVTKNDNDLDNAVAIGQIVKYTVTTSFPYFNHNETNKTFKISDTISGAEYVGLEDDQSTINEKTAVVTIGGVKVSADFVKNTAGTGFTVDLSSYIDDSNTNAGKVVVVEYEAKVKALEVENTASSHISNVTVDSNPVKLYSGKITLVKTDATNTAIKLSGAGFEVTKKNDPNTPLKFVQKDATKNEYTYDEKGTITEVFTDSNGNVVVEGLDIGTYVFTEKTAPKGYSINETATEIELDITDEGEAVEGIAVKVYEDAGTMLDTKLSALPSTGGIGTTIFTIGGCIIMILAAALFFINRRRSADVQE